MQEKIDNIFKIEGTISSLANYLYELELYDSRDIDSYREFLELYKFAALDEEKIFSLMTKEEIDKLEAFFLDNNSSKLITKYINKYPFDSKFLPFSGRLQSRIGEFKKHNFKVISFGSSSNNEGIKKIMDDASDAIPLIVNAISSEYKDIYLSFIDEYIKKSGYFSIKKTLTKEKYDVIYNTSLLHEKELIKRSFSTDYSLYLTSELFSITKKHNYQDIYTDVKRTFITKSIITISEELEHLDKIKEEKKDINISDIMLSYLRIRSCMLMLDMETFNNIIDLVKTSGIDFENGTGLLDEDILSAILNDRKRHKVLSFRKK